MPPKTNEEWVEEFENNFSACCLHDSGDMLIVTDWLRTLLTEKDKEREEAVAEAKKMITDHFNDFASAVDTDTDYCRGVKFGLRFALEALTPPDTH